MPLWPPPSVVGTHSRCPSVDTTFRQSASLNAPERRDNAANTARACARLVVSRVGRASTATSHCFNGNGFNPSPRSCSWVRAVDTFDGRHELGSVAATPGVDPASGSKYFTRRIDCAVPSASNHDTSDNNDRTACAGAVRELDFPRRATPREPAPAPAPAPAPVLLAARLAE